jgi:plastocyanin
MRTFRSAAAVVAAFALALGVAAALPAAEEKKVDITDKGFSPEKLEVKAGEKVVWKNMTDREHTVTSNEKAPARAAGGAAADEKPLFDSGPIKPGATWEHTFTQSGTFGYHCRIDKNLKGTVVVKAAN